MSEWRIEGIQGIESNYDVVMKILPTMMDMAGEGQYQSAQRDLERKQRELELAEQHMAQLEESQGQNLKDQMRQEELAAKTGRDDAGIRGMKNEDSGDPIDESGLEATPPSSASIPITRSWFVDNFGMSSAQVVDLLIKAGREDAIETLEPLIMAERREIVKQFSGVKPSIIEELPLTDSDYEQLNKNPDRFGLHFRQLVKHWNDTNDEDERTQIAVTFRERISKAHRLSPRENSILQRCADVMNERGAMNAQTLKSYGVSAPPKEIAKLIRSHGFLFDIIKAGQGKKSDDRGLFYDIQRTDVLIKNCGRLIGALLDSGGDISIDSRGSPRLTIPFSSRNAPAYADAIKSEMGVMAVKAEGANLIIEGENAVRKALSWSVPSMVEKREEATILLKAIEGNEKAQMIFAYEQANTDMKVKLLKQWNWSSNTFDQIKKEVTVNAE